MKIDSQAYLQTITVPCNSQSMRMGKGGLETNLTIHNICTKRLLSKSFTAEIVALLYVKN